MDSYIQNSIFSFSIYQTIQWMMEGATHLPKTTSKLVLHVKLSCIVLAVIHFIIVMMSLYIWFAEGRPNLELLISTLAIIAVFIGYRGASTQKTPLLLGFCIALVVFLALELANLFISVSFLILFIFNVVSINTNSTLIFILISSAVIFLNLCIIALLLFAIRSSWQLRLLLIRSNIFVVESVGGDIPYGEDSMPYVPPVIELEDKEGEDLL